MRRRRRAAACAACALLAGAAPACELVLAEHRSGHELARVALDPAAPSVRIAFTHSVLGTPVQDRYVWRAGDGHRHAHLVEERFEGDGYGLPNAAAPGERLQRDGAGWRLTLDRVVHPLVVRPLPAQAMRVLVGERPALSLGALSAQAIELHTANCPSP